MRIFKWNVSPSAVAASVLLFGQTSCSVAQSPPPFWQFAPTPPMGWNSYDSWGTSINEAQVRDNATYMKAHLLPHGWRYVVIDARWYDSVSSYNDRDFNRDRTGAQLSSDQYGRLLPSPTRFPSSGDGNGFKSLADSLHAMGLKFGFHLMRGIPRQAVNNKVPIEGSAFTAADAGDPSSKCSWCPDMYGVRDNPAGQAWYDSVFRLYASWGLDFVKVDDLSLPYHGHEIAMIRKAIDKCGRAIVFSTSPGPTDPVHADEMKILANQWRISGDFWDRWGDLNHQFDLLAKWPGATGPGHFPDADMIPFGHIGIKCTIAGPDRETRFTHDEQLTLMSLWSLASSPLILGGNLPDSDDWTAGLLTNDEVLAIDQDPLGQAANRVLIQGGYEVWVKEMSGGAKAIGIFNRGQDQADVALNWQDLGLAAKGRLRDVWQHRDIGDTDTPFSCQVPPHGVLLLRASAQ